MKSGNRLTVMGFIILSVLGGCLPMNSDDQNTALEKDSDDDYYASVQDYTGEEYTLDNGKKTNQIANDNHETVEEAVIRFFAEKYKTEVIIHNIVGNVDGATVFVESVGEPHFYTYAIIPINVKNEAVMTEHVWTQEGQVENAIVTGLYGMVYQEEFANLDRMLEGLSKEYDLSGKRLESLANIGGRGYGSPYYFVQIRNREIFSEIITAYLENPENDIEAWRKLFEQSGFSAESLSIGIQMFMSKKNMEPSQDALDAISSAMEEANHIPTGTYGIHLHDNGVSKSSGQGSKDNSIKRSYPNDIIKE